VRANGVVASPSPGKQSVALFDLPSDLLSGGEVELSVDFRAPMKLDPKTGSAARLHFLGAGLGAVCLAKPSGAKLDSFTPSFPLRDF